MTSEDVKKVTFERGIRGYRVEDVDDFLSKTAQAIDDLTRERDEALAGQQQIQQEMENKMYILAQKVEEYRGQEDTLKTALINAQRMGETVVHEAKQKADSLLRDASGKAELLRQQAESEILKEQRTLEKLQTEVTRFKATILNLYKQHIESLSALDAPVIRVDDFLREMGFEKPIEPLEETPELEVTDFAHMGEEQEGDEDEEDYDYEEDEEEEYDDEESGEDEEEETDESSEADLFGGVPVEHDPLP